MNEWEEIIEWMKKKIYLNGQARRMGKIQRRNKMGRNE